MMLLGIDFGNMTSCVAVYKNGLTEVIEDNLHNKYVPSFVSFLKKNQRTFGSEAYEEYLDHIDSQQIVYGFKQFLGNEFENSANKNVVLNVTTDEIEFRINDQFSLPVEEITRMYLVYLKTLICNSNELDAHDCVISVPFQFTNNQRLALIRAASKANLNVIRLVNDTTAAAIGFKFDNPDIDVGNVIFVVSGYLSLQLSICKIEKSGINVLACLSDKKLAFSIINNQLMKDLIEILPNLKGKIEFKSKLLNDINKNSRSTDFGNFLKEELTNLEYGKTVVNVAFRKILYQRLEKTISKCLQRSGLIGDGIIQEVVIVGQYVHMPLLKKSLKKILGAGVRIFEIPKEIIAVGCAKEAAILNQNIDNMHIRDIQNYCINLRWRNGSNDDQVCCFEENLHIPRSLAISFSRNPDKDFWMEAFYPHNKKTILNVRLKNISSYPSEYNQIIAKLCINSNGIIRIANMCLVNIRENHGTQCTFSILKIHPKIQNKFVEIETDDNNGDSIFESTEEDTLSANQVDKKIFEMDAPSNKNEVKEIEDNYYTAGCADKEIGDHNNLGNEDYVNKNKYCSSIGLNKAKRSECEDLCKILETELDNLNIILICARTTIEMNENKSEEFASSYMILNEAQLNSMKHLKNNVDEFIKYIHKTKLNSQILKKVIDKRKSFQETLNSLII